MIVALLNQKGGVGTLQLACARWQETWDDITIASCHTRDAGEWQTDATPEHGLYPAMRAIARHERVFLFTSESNSPAHRPGALLTAGYGNDEITISVAARLQLPGESIQTGLLLDAAAASEFRAAERHAGDAQRSRATCHLRFRRPRLRAALARQGVDHQAGSARSLARQAGVT